MAIILPFPLTPQEMRILQEFRRIAADTMPVAAIRTIKHPTGGGEVPALSLVDKGYLTVDGERENFALTEKAKSFLAIDAKPTSETAAEGEEPAV